MKQVLIISIVLCSSVVLAQTSQAPSSVYDVPANKIKPDYDKQVPAVKPVNIKTAAPVTSSPVVVVTDKNSSTYVSDKPVAVKPAVADNSGSVSSQNAAAKPATKVIDNSNGSVAPDTKKAEPKPVAKPTGAQSVNG